MQLQRKLCYVKRYNYHPIWLKEAESRMAAYRAGELGAVDADEVFTELGTES